MKYFELTFLCEPASETINDVLSAILADVGFETFMTNEEGNLQAYIQQSLFDEATLADLLATFPLPDVSIRYEKREPADINWNETWENEGFEPIYIDNQLVVCDTRHEVNVNDDDNVDVNDDDNDDDNANGGGNKMRRLLIHPRQAFGTGSHQTTRMLLSTLLQMKVEGLRVIDAGCGTGILGFLCLMQGASYVLAYDIDDWSVRNTQDNAILNELDINKLDVLHGDSSVLIDAAINRPDEEKFDLLIANINRNILLGDMTRFMRSLRPSARILFSGFYEEDVPYLLDAAAPYGFKLELKRNDGEWAMLLLQKSL